MFFDLLNIKAPEWYKTFIDGRRLTSEDALCTLRSSRTHRPPFSVYRKPRNLPERLGEHKSPERPPETLKLTDQYIALLVLVFTNVGLLDVSVTKLWWHKLMPLSGADFDARRTDNWLQSY